VKYHIPESDAELLKACRVDVMKATGPGGQSVNTTDSAVRITHKESGITTLSRRERSQLLNKKAALARLRLRLMEANYEARPRRTPKPPANAEERRLEEKRRRAQKIKQRTKPVDFGERDH